MPNSWKEAPKHGLKLSFKLERGYDHIENGVSISFNNVITETRKKLIITMLGKIRVSILERMLNLILKGCKWDVH